VGELRGLVVDWGGVLTIDIRDAIATWGADEGIDLDAYSSIMRAWFGEPVGAEARVNPIHALERGEMTMPDFEVRLAEALSARTGTPQQPDGLLARLLDRFEHVPAMSALVRRARRSGIQTGLLSNSWGNDYPRDGWDEMFDVVVISGEVGMRKPEPRIFEHTLRLLGLPAAQCVFVDDVPGNVAAAVGVGMVGVRHRNYADTLAELEVLFDRPLR
jgi:HAD superfamily hydrolase (TIGR01509 family)